MHAAPAQKAPGIEPRQIAEVLVALPGGAARRGSGYRVGRSAVLTAAHVVAGAERVQVRFDADRPGEWITNGLRVLADERSDLAAVVIEPPPGAPPAAAPGFARIGDAASEISVQAIGFPRFKLRAYGDPAPDSVYRDSHQATGTVAALSNRRSRTFEVTVRPPERDPDPSTSPWEGMSGAALWAGGRIVGVLTDHHRSDGLGRLVATRIDRLVEQVAENGAAADAGELLGVLGLPQASHDLPDAGTGRAPEPRTTAYHHQVVDIAPERLLGREAELAELAAFARGGEPCGWWQAGPWAGKTALMAWFALHPPPDVDVVGFFVASALAGQSDSDAFLEAMSEQLTLLAEQPPGVPATTAARRRNLLPLLESAARRCRDVGRRLVIVVDGLDEDTGEATRKPSIASLLPRHPPDGLRVVVTSRPDRSLPLDVPADHPLQRCPRRWLRVSPHAQDDEVFARRELHERLRGGPLHEDVLGLITASGGGLGRDDLAELTGSSPVTIAELLRGTFGHSIATRVQRLAGSAGSTGEARGYLLGHRTLRETAEREFGPRLGGYRQRLHAWADDHLRSGWPKDTPIYLLRDYPRMLAMVGDTARLAALAADADRHDRMLEITGGDALALDEIALARSVGLRRPVPDLTEAVLLAVRHEELARRNTGIPVQLPAVWAAMGELVRAEALARGIPRPRRRDAALAQAAVAAAAAGHVEQAEQLAEGIEDPDQRDPALTGIAVAAARHDVERAERIARRMTPDRRDTALVRIASAVAVRDAERAAALVADLAVAPDGARARVARALAAVGAGELDLAEAVVQEIGPAPQRARACAELAGVLAAAGHLDRAERLLATVRRSGVRVQALAELAQAAAAGDDGEAAQRVLTALREAAGGAAHRGEAIEVLLDLSSALRGGGRATTAAVLEADAEDLAEQIDDADRREWAAARLAVARAESGDQQGADAVLDGLRDPERVASALTSIALAAARDGDPARAEAAVRRLPAGRRQMQALAELAAVLAARGGHGRAAVHAAEVERLARDVSDPRWLATVAVRVTEGLTALGEHACARGIAERIGDGAQRGSALARVAESLAEVGDVAGAEEIARSLSDPELRAWVLVGVGAAHGVAGRRAEAVAIASEVSAAASGIRDPFSRVVALARMSSAVRAGGAPDQAVRLAAAAERELAAVESPGRQVRALVQLAALRAEAGDETGAGELAGRSEAILAAIEDPGRRDRVCTRVAEALAAAGQAERAADVGDRITAPAGRVRALAAAAAAADHEDRAWALLNRADADLALVADPDERAVATGRLACAAAAVLLASGPEPAGPRRSWLTRMVAELLTSDSWIEAMPVIARLDRNAFDAVAAWVCARLDPGDGLVPEPQLNSSSRHDRPDPPPV